MKALTIIALLISNCYLSLAALEMQAQSVDLAPNQVTPPSLSLGNSESVTKGYKTGDDACRVVAKWQKSYSGGRWDGPAAPMITAFVDGQFWAELRFPVVLTLSEATCPINTVTFRLKLIGFNYGVQVYHSGGLVTYSYNDFMAALGEPLIPDREERRLLSVDNSAVVTLKCTGCSIAKIRFVQSKEGHTLKTDQYSFGFEGKEGQALVEFAYVVPPPPVVHGGTFNEVA